jgi:hypothetical protein
MSKDNVMIVVGVLGSEPGGFTMRNMGPDKVVVEPGKPFPKAWIDPTTMATLVKDKHMVETSKQSEYGNKVEAPEEGDKKPEDPKDDEVKFPEDVRKEQCVFDAKDLKDMKRADLDDIVAGVYESTELEVPDFANKEEIIAFLTSGTE